MAREWFSDIEYSILSTLLVLSSKPVANEKEFLADITVLELSSRSLTEIPSFIKNMPNLKVLSLSFNQIDRVESGMFPDSLMYLNLAHNYIKEFSFECFSTVGLARIATVDLSSNQLSDIPSKVYLAQDLDELVLSDNDINVPYSKLPVGLKQIHLDRNGIASLGKMAKELSSCYNVSLEGNELKSLPRELFSRKLVSLNVKGNPLVNFDFIEYASETSVRVRT